MFFLDPLTILVIAVAAIVGWRLWSVLGQRTGFEREWPKTTEPPPKITPKTIDLEADRQPVSQSANNWEKYAAPGSPLATGLLAVADRDRSFSAENFLAGAAKAYEMINVAFAKGDKKALQPLLSRDLMKEFATEIDRRASVLEKMAWQLVKIDSTTLRDASIVGNLARLSVHFVSSVISATTDKDGKAVEGHMTAIEKVEDVWSFERSVSSSDPNWKLIATTPQ